MDTLAPTTNHMELKRKMLDASIKKHQTVIDDFQQNIKDLLASEGNINEEEFDLSQQEYNAEALQQVNRIADQLKFANDEMVTLYNMMPTIGTIHNSVQLGSTVVTDKDIFFVSASIERFEVDGLKVFGLSTESPLFKAMEGMKKGDRFTYGKDTYEIKDVY
jgi:transcription elongation GreA/GreB family factor